MTSAVDFHAITSLLAGLEIDGDVFNEVRLIVISFIHSNHSFIQWQTEVHDIDRKAKNQKIRHLEKRCEKIY